MPFVNASLKDAKEDAAVPEGEYDLQIIKVQDKESKKGNSMTQVTIKVNDPARPNARLVNHFLVHIAADTPPEQVAMRLRDAKRFLTVFNVPYEDNGYNTDDLMGAQGRCFLTQRPSEDDPKEVYNELRLPRLKDEEPEAQKAPGGRKRLFGG